MLDVADHHRRTRHLDVPQRPGFQNMAIVVDDPHRGARQGRPEGDGLESAATLMMDVVDPGADPEPVAIDSYRLERSSRRTDGDADGRLGHPVRGCDQMRPGSARAQSFLEIRRRRQVEWFRSTDDRS